MIWKKRAADGLPTWSKKPTRVRPRLSIPKIKLGGGDGPGLLFFLVALVVVAVAGARFLGFAPDLTEEFGLPAASKPVTRSSETLVIGPAGEERSALSDGEAGTEVPAATSADGASGPRVIIYHAHASENYQPNPPHARGGRRGDIVEVGAEL